MRLGGVLALRTGAVIAATVVTSVLLSVALSELKFEQKLREISGSRLTVVADEMRRRVEYGLTLGLDLSELVDLQAQTERAATGEDILGVEVVDERGIVLFASDRGAVGHPDPNRWAVDAGDGVHQRITGDVLIVGTDVRNSFGQTVGKVILRSSLAGLRERVAVVESGLHVGTLALVGIAALATLAAVVLVVRRGGLRSAAGPTGPTTGPGGGGAGGRGGQGSLGVVRDRLSRGIADADLAMEELERELDAMAPMVSRGVA